MVQFLIQACDVDVNCPNIKGETPLYIACSMGIFDIVQSLINSGANVDLHFNEIPTPLLNFF